MRIGLATKQLNLIKTRDLLQLLIDLLDEPITTSKLSKLRARTLRKAGEALFENTSDECFEKAFALLKGRGVKKLLASLTAFGDGTFCEILGYLRVACGSNGGEVIDGEFISCLRFLIYQVSPTFIRLIDIREPSTSFPPKEDHQRRASLLKDCALLLYHRNRLGGDGQSGQSGVASDKRCQWLFCNG